MSPERLVLLPNWLSLPPISGVRTVGWDGAGPAGSPDPEVLAQVECFVPRYMGGVDDVKIAAQMPRLDLLQTLTAGVDGIAEFLPPGARLCSAAGVHDASTAELAVGLMIAAQRGLDVAVRDALEGYWGHERRRSLADSRVLLVGVGGVGGAIADRLAPFEVDLVKVGRQARQGVLGMADLDEELTRADIVVLAVPLTSDTRGLLDARRLGLLPDGALVVNVSRGPIVSTSALTAEVRAGRLRAAVDVTDPEPLPSDHPLWRAPGAIITAHIGGNSAAFVPRAKRFLAAQLRRWAHGEPLTGLVATPSH